MATTRESVFMKVVCDKGVNNAFPFPAALFPEVFPELSAASSGAGAETGHRRAMTKGRESSVAEPRGAGAMSCRDSKRVWILSSLKLTFVVAAAVSASAVDASSLPRPVERGPVPAPPSLSRRAQSGPADPREYQRRCGPGPWHPNTPHHRRCRPLLPALGTFAERATEVEATCSVNGTSPSLAPLERPRPPRRACAPHPLLTTLPRSFCAEDPSKKCHTEPLPPPQCTNEFKKAAAVCQSSQRGQLSRAFGR